MAWIPVFDLTIDQTTPDIFAEWLATPAKFVSDKFFKFGKTYISVDSLQLKPEEFEPPNLKKVQIFAQGTAIISKPQIQNDSDKKLEEQLTMLGYSKLLIDTILYPKEYEFELGIVEIYPLGNGVQAVGYSENFPEIFIKIAEKIQVVYGRRAHNNLINLPDPNDHDDQNKLPKTLENMSHKGRYRLTNEEIKHRKSIVMEAEAIKKEYPQTKWKQIAKQLNVPERTLRDWRHNPIYK